MILIHLPINYLRWKTNLPTPINSIALAHYRDIRTYSPRIGDFIIWHGWWSKWYGVVSAVNGDLVEIVCENLPKLLLTLIDTEYKPNSIIIKVNKIRASRGGQWSVIQEDPELNGKGIWYIDV
jgi:hypothetical protein